MNGNNTLRNKYERREVWKPSVREDYDAPAFGADLFTNHALDRMRERRLSMADVYRSTQHGPVEAVSKTTKQGRVVITTYARNNKIGRFKGQGCFPREPRVYNKPFHIPQREQRLLDIPKASVSKLIGVQGTTIMRIITLSGCFCSVDDEITAKVRIEAKSSSASSSAAYAEMLVKGE